MEQPNYYAIIPACVRYAKIKANAKLLYGEITALANKTGECYAGNSYFAGLYDVSEKQVSLWIKELAENGFITIRIDKSQGNKRYIGIYQKVMTYEPKGNDPMNQKVIHNNTSNNTSNISYKEDTKSEDFETQLDLLGDFLDNKQEGVPTPRADINNLIQVIKDECKRLGKAYDSSDERHFAKHIIGAKQFGEFCDTIGLSRIEFAKRIMRYSIDIKYRTGPCCGPKMIYKNYSGVYNKKMEKKSTGIQDTHSKDYTEGLENIKPLLL